jgi:hypothetical protein
MKSDNGIGNAVEKGIAARARFVKAGWRGSIWTALGAWLLVGSVLKANPAAVDDGFAGPFASWVNVKSECGAKGDGLTDDTAPIQQGLDIINPVDAKRKVLYFPAGVYRISKTLNVPRIEHAQAMGIGIIGEDPATTIIAWDGPPEGRMFYYCPWYARMMRLTLDGRDTAKDAIFHGKPFATALGYTDMVFKGVQFGIEAGEREGIAECLVLRCKFIRCSKAGLSIQNFNTLDWWVWHSIFEDCHIGVSSEYDGGGGHFHVYESLFQRSTEADITMMHTSYFGIRHNTSINSKAFFVAKRAANWTDQENHGASTHIQGNRIYDPLDVTPIRIANAGNILFTDNVIRSRAEVKRGPVIHLATPSGDADMVALGNTFTVTKPFDVQGRLSTQDEKTVSRASIKTVLPTLPGTAPNLQGKVFEIPAGSTAEVIQQAVAGAAKLAGQRPVLHFPEGEYPIARTIDIPAGSDLMLVGDSLISACNLNWAGAENGPVFLVHGPSHAIFRELYINCANKAVGVRVDNCDQVGGRVNLQEVWADAATSPAGLYVNGLDCADVSTMGCGFGKITSIGGPQARRGKRQRTQVVCYGYSGGSRDTYELQDGGSLLMQDGWYEGPYRTFCRLTGKGTFTVDGGMVAVGNYQNKVMFPGEEGKPAIDIDGLEGRAAVIGLQVLSVDPTRPALINVGGNRTDMEVLLLGGCFQPEAFTNAASNARVVLFHNRHLAKGLGTASSPDQGAVDTAFLREMLAQTRNARLQPFHPAKPDVTDVRFDRVFLRNGPRSIELLARERP